MGAVQGLCNPWPFIADPADQPEDLRVELSRRALENRITAVRSGGLSEDAYYARRKSGLSDLSPLTGRYWLWRMHHRHNEVWKCVGRPNWSLEAYVSWHRTYWRTPEARRLDRNGHPRRETLPKREAGLQGLRHEHVIPMGLMLRELLEGHLTAGEAVMLNQDAVITVGEDRRLDKSGHPDIRDPWRRYAGTGIRFVPNPQWSGEHEQQLRRHALVASSEEVAAALVSPGEYREEVQ